MSGWFARVGLPLTPAESTAIGKLISSVAPNAPYAVTALATWHEAAAFVRVSEFDSTWWDQEEEERESLWARVTDTTSETELLRRINESSAGLDAQIRSAAFAAATAAGVTDMAIVGEATGAALLAAQQSALAEMAGEKSGHRFALKYALFTGGRWPLGYHSARFVIF